MRDPNTGDFNPLDRDAATKYREFHEKTKMRKKIASESI